MCRAASGAFSFKNCIRYSARGLSIVNRSHSNCVMMRPLKIIVASLNLTANMTVTWLHNVHDVMIKRHMTIDIDTEDTDCLRTRFSNLYFRPVKYDSNQIMTLPNLTQLLPLALKSSASAYLHILEYALADLSLWFSFSCLALIPTKSEAVVLGTHQCNVLYSIFHTS